VITVASLLANDTDVDFDTLSIVGFNQPTKGTLVNNGDGTFTYTPNTDYIGTDSFTYTISDGQGGSDTATVTVAVEQAFYALPPDTELPDGDPAPPTEEPPSATPPESGNGSDDDATDQDSGTVTRDPRYDFTLPGDSTTVTDAALTSIILETGDLEITGDENDELIGSPKIALRTLGRDIRSLNQAAAIREVSIKLDAHQLWEELDVFRDEVASSMGGYTLTVGAATGVATIAAAGYTMWMVRGGYLVASFLSSLPAWSSMDPLPILVSQSEAHRKSRNQPQDLESLQTMIGLGTSKSKKSK